MTITKKIRYSLTLLEVSIATTLVAILLSSLWGLYHSWLTTYQKQQKIQIEAHKTLFLKKRLDLLASLMASPAHSDQESNFLFTPQQKEEGFSTVCFSYYNEPDPDPAFNGKIRSLLYLNGSRQLCLASWSFEKKVRIEVLLQPVASFSLTYFDPMTNLWRDEWPEEFEHLPLWMKLQVEGDETRLFLFRLDNPTDPILFLEKQFDIQENTSS